MELKEIKVYENQMKIRLTDDERVWVADILESLKSRLKSFDEINTDGVEPLVYNTGLNNVMREDKAVNFENKKALLANAPKEYDGYFEVPKTVE